MGGGQIGLANTNDNYLRTTQPNPTQPILPSCPQCSCQLQWPTTNQGICTLHTLVQISHTNIYFAVNLKHKNYMQHKVHYLCNSQCQNINTHTETVHSTLCNVYTNGTQILFKVYTRCTQSVHKGIQGVNKV